MDGLEEEESSEDEGLQQSNQKLAGRCCALSTFLKKCQREMSETEELLSGPVLPPPVSWCLLFEGEDSPYSSFCLVGAGNCHDAADTHCRGLGSPGVRG